MIDVKSLMGAGGSSSQVPKEGAPLAAGSLTSIDQVKKGPGRPARPYGGQARPRNMKREVYNLLIQQPLEGRDIQSLVPSNAHAKYKNPKVVMGKRRAYKYKWMPFLNEARKDGLTLSHWVREDKLQSTDPYLFAQFNKVINIPAYDDDDYRIHLQCLKWTREETDLLFEICRRFDLRWPVVADRYETERQRKSAEAGKPAWEKRSIEDMKERFYSVVSELNVVRNPEAEPIAYDAEHERRRKEQLRKQFDRTSEEIEEEERLQEDLKRIEARRRERERKAQDLQKLINMEQHSPSISGAHSPAPGKKKLLKNKLGGGATVSAIAPNIQIEIPSASTLRFSTFGTSGAHLRSQEMKLPTNVGQKKLKNIETVIKNLEIDVNPMGAEETVTAYNEFRSNIVLLQELKQTLQTAEFDLESLRSRLLQQGLPAFEIESRMRMSTLPNGGYNMSMFEGLSPEDGAPATSRRIASWLDVTPQTGILSTRKRKVPSSTPPIEFKKSRKS